MLNMDDFQMANNDVDVLLTADRTLMSNYHGNEFLGFGTCAPSNFIPDVLYSYLFFPPIGQTKGCQQLRLMA